jgi:hypothetical protein
MFLNIRSLAKPVTEPEPGPYWNSPRERKHPYRSLKVMHQMRAKSLSLSSPFASVGALALGVSLMPSQGFAGEPCAINAFARITTQVASATANTNAVSTGPLLPQATALGCGASNSGSAPSHPI